MNTVLLTVITVLFVSFTEPSSYVDVCPGVKLITRDKWGARAPKHTEDIKVPVPEFFVHHTDFSECFNVTYCCKMVRVVQNFHMDVRGWDDIGYNFLVGEDGNVYEGRGWEHVGAQVLHYNYVSFGTSVMGNFNDKLPNEKALSALQSIIACGVQLGKVSPSYRLYGHRDANSSTECPGNRLYAEIQTWPHYSHDPPLKFLFLEDI